MKSILDFFGGEKKFKEALKFEEASEKGSVDYYSALEEFALEEVAEELTEELSSIEGVYGVSIGKVQLYH